MPETVGIRFKTAGKIYFFDPSGVELEIGDQVVVKTARGLELGQVVGEVKETSASQIDEELKPVVRKARPEDLERVADFQAKELEALTECRQIVIELNLPMKLRGAEYNLEGNRLTFFFTSEERVDFRQLVREVTNRLKVKVDLRQIGPRDEAKLIGGYGRCGLPLCCHNMLTDFDPVSIKMAKEQNLPLNPMKISGTCGRLLCCLTYEYKLYHEMKSKMPRPGSRVMLAAGPGKVNSSNPIKGTVMVYLDSQMLVEATMEEINNPQKPAAPPPAVDAASQQPEAPARRGGPSGQAPRGEAAKPEAGDNAERRPTTDRRRRRGGRGGRGGRPRGNGGDGGGNAAPGQPSA
jgi:cell fate regulator YaaT (PSP1 superfamily)